MFKNEFDINEVIKALKPDFKRFCAVNGVKILFTNINNNGFSLNIVRTNDDFTDDYGKKITPNSKHVIES